MKPPHFYKHVGKRLLLLAAVLSATIAFVLILNIPVLLQTQARLQNFILDAGIFGPLLFMLLMAVHVVIPPLPSLPLDIAAGALWGSLLGTLYASVGALIGAVLSFLLARYAGQMLIMKYLHKHIRLCKGCSNTYITWLIFFSRLLPIAQFDIVSYGAGLSQISLKRFTYATFFGMLAPTLLLVSTGARIASGNMGEALILGIAVSILFIFVPTLVHKYDLWHPKMQKKSKKRRK